MQGQTPEKKELSNIRSAPKSLSIPLLLLHLVICWLCGISTVAAKVTIEGLDPPLFNNTLLLMRLDDEPCDAPKWRINSLFKESTKTIERSLQAFGYYTPVIENFLTVDADCWEAKYTVQVGPQVRIRSVDIRIDAAPGSAAPVEKLLAEQPFKIDAPLVQSEYDRFKKKLLDTAISHGYFDATMSVSRLDIYSSENAADIKLLLTPGVRYSYGEITFAQDIVRPELIQRYSNIAPGQPYSAAAIGDLYDALLTSGYFESINIETEPDNATGHTVAVRITLSAGKRISVEGGIGFGTDTGMKLRAGYFDRRRNNKGHQLETKAGWSRIASEISASYRLPLNNPRAEWLNFDGGYRDEDTDTSSSQSVKLGVKELKLRSRGWLETRFIDVSVEDYEVAGDTGRTRLIAPGLSWSHVYSNSQGRPTQGHRLNLRVNGALEELGSDVDFGQLDVYVKLVQGLWPGGRLLARSEFGTTLKNNFSELPASIRYFVGGDNSVRGYDYKTLGPRNSDGEVIGGSHKITAGLELDQQFRENWGIALFIDSGNAFDDFSSINFKIGAGVGLRWYSFLGPIRLDVAVPLDSDADDSFRVHINLGPDL